MSIVRLWITFDTRDLTPAQTRAAFVEAIRTAIVTAQQQGRVEHAIAQQLRYALERRRESAE